MRIAPILLLGFAGLLVPSEVAARLGQTLAELEAEYGPYTKRQNEVLGGGAKIYTYRCDNYQIEVTVLEGRSVGEIYAHVDRSPLSPQEVELLLSENPSAKGGITTLKTDQATGEGSPIAASGIESSAIESFSLSVPSEDTRDDFESAKPTSMEQTFTGIAHLKEHEGDAWAVITSDMTVIEIPLGSPKMPNRIPLTEGKKYSITVVDERPEYLGSQIAVVSDLEHHTWAECVDDGRPVLLVQIRLEGKVIYDRSVCELHHTNMELRTVEINYGMYGPANWAESYCDAYFPHHRDFALGGCVDLEEPSKCSLYICSKCVAACADYKRKHPANEKPPPLTSN